jgi:hypothetical protein
LICRIGVVAGTELTRVANDGNRQRRANAVVAIGARDHLGIARIRTAICTGSIRNDEAGLRPGPVRRTRSPLLELFESELECDTPVLELDALQLSVTSTVETIEIDSAPNLSPKIRICTE